MQALILSVLLGVAAPGIYAHEHNHNHAHLHKRAEATVVDVFTTWVTEYVYKDGSKSTASSTSTSLEAIFIQLSTSSAVPTTSAAVAILAQAIPEVKSSTTSTTTSTIPTTTATPTHTTTKTTSTSIAVTTAASVAGERTFTIINSHTNAVSTQHDNTFGTPTSAGKEINPGTIAAGATATFAVSVGWIGNIGLNDADFPITSDSTLIEANFVPWFGTPRADFDISYVNGFTLPAVCSCAGTVTTGCNIDLNTLAECPSGLENNSCANPLRSSFIATSATSYFAPCQGLAWTFVEDGDADSNCETGHIECCIGAACPPHPDQKK